MEHHIHLFLHFQLSISVTFEVKESEKSRNARLLGSRVQVVGGWTVSLFSFQSLF